MLAVRDRMGAEECAAAAEQCREAIAGLVPPQAVVGGYVTFRKELDVSGVMEMLAARGHSLCLPVIEEPDRALYFRKWKLGDVLEKGRYGIPIPPAGAPVFRPNVLLVPVVAFDRSGHRLGYGAGYYDRTIAKMRADGPALAIGVAYARQEVQHIPAGRHDQVLDVIVTEKNIMKVDE